MQPGQRAPQPEPDPNPDPNEGQSGSLADEALAIEHAQLKMLYESTPLMYFTLDLDGSVKSVNSFGAAELGYSPQDLIGLPVLDVFHDDDRDRVAAGIRDVLAHPDRVGRWEARKHRRDGTLIWVSEIVRVIEYEDGEKAILVICENITERKQTEAKLREYREALSRLSLNLTLAEERERRRIAIGLHDHIGQSLGLCRLYLERLRGLESRTGDGSNNTDSKNTDSTVDEIAGLLESTIGSCRSLTFDLSSPILYELGLVPALRQLGSHFEDESGVDLRFIALGDTSGVDETVAVILHRCTREVLRNIRRHAGASKAEMHLLADGERLELTVEDDGVGTPEDGERLSTSGFGIFSMMEQLNQIGGDLQISPGCSGGTRVHITAPLKAPDEDHAAMGNGGGAS